MPIDLTGQRFGRLVVLRQGKSKILPSGQIVKTWVCLCDCGNETTVYQQHLKRGDTKSCGCFLSEESRKRKTTHGETKTRLYKIWDGMRQRCKNPNDAAFRHYGARGISICKEWDNYLKFKEWALSHGYCEDLSIDRVDVNGNYEPSNCRWANAYEQSNNKTTSHYLEFDGKKQTIAQWAKELNMPMETLYRRITKYHWNIEDALTKPIRNYNLKRRYNNDTQTSRNGLQQQERNYHHQRPPRNRHSLLRMSFFWTLMKA